MAEYVEPGYDKAYLVTPKGETIDLEKDSDTIFIKENKSSFSNKGKKLVQLESEKSEEKGSPLFSQYKIVVPNGGIYQLELLDGTRVWLNSNSELTFSNTNTGFERRVQLRGEGYFEVAKDSKRPFIVETVDMSIQVLGTQFDVKAYSDDIIQHVTLVEGKVQVSLNNDAQHESEILNPDQQIVFSTATNEIVKRNVRANNFIGWKEGIFQFNNEDMKTILNKLSRWYNIAIVSEYSDLDKIHFTGELQRFEQLGKILKLLEIGTDIEFEIADQQVFVRKNK